MGDEVGLRGAKRLGAVELQRDVTAERNWSILRTLCVVSSFALCSGKLAPISTLGSTETNSPTLVSGIIANGHIRAEAGGMLGILSPSLIGGASHGCAPPLESLLP